MNHLAGHHLFALIEPHRPRRVQEHQLAALFPYDGVKRQVMAAHLDRSEILQMLHRNRQVQARLNHNHIPYVIVAFEPPDDVHRLQETLDPPIPVDLQWRGQPLKEMIRIVCAELLQQFKAVPTLALMAIGLMATPTSYRAIVRHVRNRLREVVWTPHLRRWSARTSYFSAYQKKEAQMYTAAKKSKRTGRQPVRQVDRIDAIMNEHFSDLLKLTKYKINLPSGFAESIKFKYPSRLVVWAESEKDAHKTLAELLKT